LLRDCGARSVAATETARIGSGTNPYPDVQPLQTLLLADASLAKNIVLALHELFMSVMKDTRFRQLFAASFAKCLPAMTTDATAGRGPFAHALNGFGVHILTVPSIVTRLTQSYPFLNTLLSCLEVRVGVFLHVRRLWRLVHRPHAVLSLCR
jgi:hypothetical protein